MAVREPSIQPLIDADVLDVIDIQDEGFAVTDDVLLVSTPGHTPGHVSVLIRSSGSGGEAEALITGDAFHSPLQFAYPELAAWRFDTDSEQSTATRQRLLDEFVDTDTLLLGTHFAPPTAGHLRQGNAGVWFDGAAPDAS
jgi:glyoxylase-like metal-dependent hydrolase (beta-lactamase superfamily II)